MFLLLQQTIMPSLGHTSAGLCLVAVIATLFGVALIVGDINNLKTEVERRLDEFKLIADDTWERLLILQKPTGSSTAAMLSVFRKKRFVYPGMCNCESNSQGCPAGPPGLPGAPGKRGEEGHPGDSGRPGANGISLLANFDQPGGCIKCPPGLQGPQGPAGAEGENGFPGSPGKAGPPGNDGLLGAVGVSGVQGIKGMAGFDGPNGPDGMPGSVSLLGAPGQIGEPGWTGPPGLPGKHGESGKDGVIGETGPPGTSGQAGHDGHFGLIGAAGKNGLVGDDASYCPCPTRSQDDTLKNPAGSNKYPSTPSRSSSPSSSQIPVHPAVEAIPSDYSGNVSSYSPQQKEGSNPSNGGYVHRHRTH